MWQVWHIIPDIQAHYSTSWIIWHDIEGISLRILMTWIYNNTGRSVFTSILVHAMSNLSWSLFPNYGSHYNPSVTGIITTLAALIAIIGWGPKTLAQYKFS